MLSTMMRRVVRVSLGCSVAFCGVLAASAAQANPAFPMELQAAVPMPCQPACTLCHNTIQGGPGNLRPSGIVKTWTDPTVVMGAPLDGNNMNSLGPVVMEIKALNPPLDTDKDGVPDIMELQMGEDPNQADGLALCAVGGGSTTAGPVYGCARVAPNGKVDDLGAVASAFVALLGVSAVRRRASRRRSRVI
jgi:hypothetical protein